MRRSCIVGALAMLSVSTLSVGVAGQEAPDSGAARAGISGPPDESQYVSRPVPDIAVHTLRGPVRLSALWERGPVLLTLVFTRCAGVCSPFLRSLRAADEGLGEFPDLQRVVLSFDPRDTAADMAQSARHLGVADRPGWTFGTAEAEDLQRLTRSLGFWFTWDETRQQYDHPAIVAGIRQGTVARLLVGGSVTTARLGEVVREARGQFVASYPLPGAVLFRCFEYDPATGQASLARGAAVLLVPALGAGVVTFALFARPRRRSTRLTESGAPHESQSPFPDTPGAP